MKVVLFHLTGNANVKGVAYGLAKAKLLYEYNVTIASFAGSLLDKIGSLPSFSEIKRRELDSLLKPFTHTWPLREAGRILLPKIGLSILTEKFTSPFFIDNVVQNIDKRVAGRLQKARKNGAVAVYGYEDTTVHSFREAKRLGMACLYDLPIGYWKAARALLEEERKKWPGWASTISILHDAPEKLERKEEELRLADQIFVASSFTAQTLQYHEGSLPPKHVIPYGFPDVDTNQRVYDFNENRPLKLLFVGSLSQRKGIANLFKVADNLKKYVKLTIVGHKVTSDCQPLEKELAKHKWIPSLPHQSILKLMREHDVLVFPSLFEGFGLVITEAMSQGTPVITTERTAGPDLIKSNKNGWLIQAGSTEALQQAVEYLLNKPDEVAKAGINARVTAAQRPWNVYEKEMAKIVQNTI